MFLSGISAYHRWAQANVVRGVAKGTVSAVGVVASRRRHRGAVPWDRRHRAATSTSRSGSPTARTSSSAASPRRSSPELYDRLEALGMAEPGAELARDVVACPGADTCNLAVTQSRGPGLGHR